ncbi:MULTISPECIES: ABC transporter ATP-binding protein [Proteus]|uniref:ABC transporter ATP-binding protein n=1 Tax=Proteus TaxID=583 RepID=UPI00137692AA|nr:MULTISPECIES: ABC transporter ATP-binding protein [Proteus]MBG5949734.1 ABC transporter ATP-binding protein [Proteus terrae]MCE9839253.1 ABC transporter ATP-binding protein/permease [Proteus terrae]NBN72055.1 ATP-binding cassette domain-containing protein [Proteus sp. G2618]
MHNELWALLRPYRPLLIGALLLQAVAGFSSLVPWLALYQLLLSFPSSNTLWLTIAVIGGIVWLISQTIAFHLTHLMDAKLTYQLRLALSEKMQKLPLNWFVSQGKNGVNQYVQRDIKALHQLIAHAPADIVQFIVVPVIAIMVLSILNLSLLLFALIPLIIAYFCFKQTQSSRYQTYCEQRDSAMKALFEDYQLLAENPLVARQFPHKGIISKTEKALFNFVFHFQNWVKRVGLLGSLTQLLLSATLLTGWLLLGAVTFEQTLPLADLLLFILLLRRIAEPVMAMGHGGDALRVAKKSAQRIQQLLQQPEIQYGEQSVESISHHVALTADSVCLAYGDKKILDNINFEIKKGEFIAIVGPSGAGKSSLLQLIARFMDATSGEILIENKRLQAYSRHALNQITTVVMQNSQPLPYSIKDNLLLFNPDCREEQLQSAINETHFAEVIELLPQGLSTIINDETPLSGGEAQRLAIARAFIANSPLLLADEPSSALDPDNAQHIFNALKNKTMTRIVVTHSLALAQQVNRVIFMADGKLVAMGNHDDLLLECERYRDFVQKQGEQNED